MNNDPLNDMLANHDLGIELDPKLATLNTSYEALEKANSDFLEACTDYSGQPDKGESCNVERCRENLLRALRHSTGTLIATFGAESKEPIITLLMTEDRRRIDHFISLTEAEDLIYQDEKALRKRIEGFLETTTTGEEYIDEIMDYADDTLDSDTAVFMNKVLENFEKQSDRFVTIMFDPNPFTPAAEEVPEPGGYHNFSVQPPRTIHTPNFMEGVIFTTSDSEATYGTIWIADSVLNPAQEDDEPGTALLEHLGTKFERAVNPLGHKLLRIILLRENSPE